MNEPSTHHPSCFSTVTIQKMNERSFALGPLAGPGSRQCPQSWAAAGQRRSRTTAASATPATATTTMTAPENASRLRRRSRARGATLDETLIFLCCAPPGEWAMAWPGGGRRGASLIPFFKNLLEQNSPTQSGALRSSSTTFLINISMEPFSWA